MNTSHSILEIAKKTIRLEAEAITALINTLNEDFVKVVQIILSSKGRVVITGIGKSAIIAQKIVASLNSTGTPSIFMHAADAVHGDLGMIQQEDVVICISKSGNTPEIKSLVPLLKANATILVAIVGNTQSVLAQNAHYVLDTTVVAEACPNNLAPTTSTTAQLVIGDALVVALLEQRAFTKEDFARYHPGGALGKQLYLKSGSLAKTNQVPIVNANVSIKEVILEITKKRLGCTAVTDNQQKVLGIITDGDIRRMLEKYDNLANITAKDIMNPSPKYIDAEELATNALELLRTHNINQILVLENGKYCGVLHLHDLLKEGLL